MSGCGCTENKEVSYYSKLMGAQNVAPVNDIPKIKRSLTTTCNTIGECGIINSDQFTTSEGQTTVFTRTSSVAPRFSGMTAFQLSSGVILTAIGLRQFAEECAMLADHLDGLSTEVQVKQPVHTHAGHVKVKRKKRKLKGTKAVKTIGKKTVKHV